VNARSGSAGDAFAVWRSSAYQFGIELAFTAATIAQPAGHLTPRSDDRPEEFDMSETSREIQDLSAPNLLRRLSAAFSFSSDLYMSEAQFVREGGTNILTDKLSKAAEFMRNEPSLCGRMPAWNQSRAPLAPVWRC
jgi:hypothetical protein